MTDHELIAQALVALQYHTEQTRPIANTNFAIEALRAALAQPEPEPVAWWHDMGDVVDLNVSGRGTPLYTAPPQRECAGTVHERREWQGLTEEEIQKILDCKRYGRVDIKKAEQILKDKNT